MKEINYIKAEREELAKNFVSISNACVESLLLKMVSNQSVSVITDEVAKKFLKSFAMNLYYAGYVEFLIGLFDYQNDSHIPTIEQLYHHIDELDHPQSYINPILRVFGGIM